MKHVDQENISELLKKNEENGGVQKPGNDENVILATFSGTSYRISCANTKCDISQVPITFDEIPFGVFLVRLNVIDSSKKSGRPMVGTLSTAHAVRCLVLEITHCAISNEIPNITLFQREPTRPLPRIEERPLPLP